MNATATRLHVYVSGAVIFAVNHNENENEIYAKHNAAFHQTTGHTHTGAVGDGPLLTAAGLDLTANYPWTGNHTFSAGKLKVKGAGVGVASLQYANSAVSRIFTLPDPGVDDTLVTLTSLSASGTVPPVGSIIPFYDFNGGLTFDATHWAYCNGQVKNFPGIGAQTLPDLSGRYIVGFGTDGGADNGSAGWSVLAVGNAAHQIALNHTHTVNAHTHDLQNHTHSTPNHQHLLNDNSVELNRDGDGNVVGYTSTGFALQQKGAGAGGINFHTVEGRTQNSGSGTSGVPSTNTSGSTSPGTDSQLSATQSIQPRSIRVRYLMRYL